VQWVLPAVDVNRARPNSRFNRDRKLLLAIGGLHKPAAPVAISELKALFAASKLLSRLLWPEKGARKMDSTTSTKAWYVALQQPFFAPPAWLFGPVWSVLYVIIAVSFGYVFYLAIKKRLPWGAFVPFGFNLVFNLAFSPLQFGLKNNLLASIDILLILATLIWAMRTIWSKVRWVAYVNIPYLLWVSFATVLQLSITWLNR
jgi:translocator protein